MIEPQCNPPLFTDLEFDIAEDSPSYSGIVLSLNTSMFDFCTHISPDKNVKINTSYSCTSGNFFHPTYNNCPSTWNPPGGRVVPTVFMPPANSGMYIGKPIKIKITKAIWPTPWHKEVFLTDKKDNMSFVDDEGRFVLWKKYEDNISQNDHRIRAGVIQNKETKEYSLTTSSRAFYTVQIVGNLVREKTENTQPAGDIFTKSVEQYSPPNVTDNYPDENLRWITKPTYFHIIEAATAIIAGVDKGIGVTLYDADTETYAASIDATLGGGGSWHPFYGDYNTYPFFAPHTVGVFDATTTTISTTFTRSTSTSNNDDKIHYTIRDILPGSYYVGVTDNKQRTTRSQELIEILDGTVIFTLLDTFAPRTSYPQNRSTYEFPKNFYGTCFCSIECMKEPVIVFTPIDTTTKETDPTRTILASTDLASFYLYNTLTAGEGTKRQRYYYKVSGLSPGLYSVATSIRFSNGAHNTILNEVMIPSANSPTTVSVITKADTTGARQPAKEQNTVSCLILSDTDMPNGILTIDINGPQTYDIFEEFIPYNLDKDMGNYSYFKTEIDNYYYNKLTVNNTYKIEYRTKQNNLLKPIYLDGKIIENINHIPNLSSDYLAISITDIMGNIPTIISATFKNMVFKNETFIKYNQKIRLLQDINTDYLWIGVIESSGILTHIPEKPVPRTAPLSIVVSKIEPGSKTISVILTDSDRQKIRIGMIVLGNCIAQDTVITNIMPERIDLSVETIGSCENTTLTIIDTQSVNTDKGLIGNISINTNLIQVLSSNLALLQKDDILVANGLDINTTVSTIDIANNSIEISKNAIATVSKARITIIDKIGSGGSVIPVDHGFTDWPTGDPPPPDDPTNDITGRLRIIVFPTNSIYTINPTTSGYSSKHSTNKTLDLPPDVYTIRGDETYLKEQGLLDDPQTITIIKNSSQIVTVTFEECPTNNIPYTIIPTV